MGLGFSTHCPLSRLKRKERRREREIEKKPSRVWSRPPRGTTMAGFRDSGRGAAEPCGCKTSDVGKRKAELSAAGVSHQPCLPSPGSLANSLAAQRQTTEYI